MRAEPCESEACSDCLCDPQRRRPGVPVRHRRRSGTASQSTSSAPASSCSRPNASPSSTSPSWRASAGRPSGAGNSATPRKASRASCATRPVRPGKPPHATDTVAEVLALTCSEPPEVTHWTGRALAQAVGISLRSVQRIWDAHRLQPHRVRSFKRSKRSGLRREGRGHRRALHGSAAPRRRALPRREEPDPGSRAHPPEQACHARSPRDTDPRLHPPRHHDAVCRARRAGGHRDRAMHAASPPRRFLRFLNTIEAAVPAGKLIHVILDNYATHKHPKVRAWLARHPRWVFHFTPTSASWMNAVEGFLLGPDPAQAETGQLQRDRRPSGCDQPLHRRAQRQAKAFRLDQASRRHPQCRQRQRCTIRLSQCTSTHAPR